MPNQRRERTTETPSPLEDLIGNLKDAEVEISTASVTASENPSEQLDIADVEQGVDAIRRELIKSSEDGEINQSVKYLKKSSAKVLEKIHKQMEGKRLEKANAFITDMLLSKFADTLMTRRNH